MGTYVVLGLVGIMILWTLAKRRGDISIAEARHLVANGALLLDVRSPPEFSSGHISGAVNIPLADLAGRLAELGPKTRPVVLYCASGARSGVAARMLKRSGFATARNLGAMSRW